MLLSYLFTPYIPPLRGKSARAEYVRGEVNYFPYRWRLLLSLLSVKPPPNPLPEGESRTTKILLKEQNLYFALYNLPFHSYNPCLRPTIPLSEGGRGEVSIINYFSYRWRLLLSLLCENLPLTPSLRGNYALQRYFYKNKIPACVLHSPSSRGAGGRFLL